MQQLKTYAFIFIFLILSDEVFSQKASELPSRPFRQVIFETNFSPLPLDEVFDITSGREKTFWELTLNTGVYTNINKHFLFGFNYSQIWTRFNAQNNNTYFMAGVEGRFNQSLTERINVNASLGYHIGNYCSCLNDVRNPNELPFKRENMRFLSIGVNGNFQLYKALWFRLGLSFYKWLNKADNIYYTGFNIPNIGFQLNFK